MVRCIGGPWDTDGKGFWMRSWELQPDPLDEAMALRKRLPLPDFGGWYVKRACRKKDGSLVEKKHKGKTFIDWEYVWEQKRDAT